MKQFIVAYLVKKLTSSTYNCFVVYCFDVEFVRISYNNVVNKIMNFLFENLKVRVICFEFELKQILLPIKLQGASG